MSQWKSTIIKPAPTVSPSSNLLSAIADGMLATISENVRREVMASVAPILKEQTSWKTTVVKRPENGKDGKDGKDGKPGPKGDRGDAGPQGIPGRDGKSIVGPAGKDGQDGATWHFFETETEEQGKDGDFCLVKKTFEIFLRKEGEWELVGSIKGKSTQNFIGSTGTGAAGGGVTSVNSKTGTVTLTKEDIGLSNVENTSSFLNALIFG